MAVIYPVSILDTFPGWPSKFELMFRQEQSRTAGGATYVKDLGSPLWMGAWASRTLSANELDTWRARLDALEGGIQTFRGYSQSRAYPIAYPKRLFDALGVGSVSVAAIGSNRKSCSLTGLPPGYKVTAGDLIEVAGSGLHRVMEPATANSSGTTLTFEVRPHFWIGASAPAVVKLVRPAVNMRVVPGTIISDADPSTGKGAISFQGFEAR